jgi:hypothetical protein
LAIRDHHINNINLTPNLQNPLRSFFRVITSTLHKAYLLLLLLLHTPLYGFLGIDVLSTLTPATTSQLPQLHGATPDGRRLVRLLEEATSGEACDGAWAMRGVVALVSSLSSDKTHTADCT